jgi:hypothetical protein
MGPARTINTDECAEADLLNIVPFEDPDQSCQIKPNLCRCGPDDDECNGTPIVLNFAAQAYQFTGSDDPVIFDLTADGAPDQLTWTTAAANEAFLWRDNNGDGVVTDGSELFGNYTRFPDGSRAVNGFEALRQYDNNADDVLDAGDPEWSNLKLWFDFNHNGISEQAEIVPVADSSLVSISLRYVWSARADAYGNWLRYRSTIKVRVGSITYDRPAYDVFFLFVD